MKVGVPGSRSQIAAVLTALRAARCNLRKCLGQPGIADPDEASGIAAGAGRDGYRLYLALDKIVHDGFRQLAPAD